MFKNYIKIAYRSLAKNYGFTLINIFGLTFGITCFIFIANWAWNEYNYDQFHAKSDRIYKVLTEMGVNAESTIVPYAPSSLTQLLKENVPEIANITRVFPREVVFENNGLRITENGIYADPSFLDIFSFSLTEGNAEAIFSKPNTVVISSALAEKYFRGESALGQTINVTYKDKEPYVVTGVLNENPNNSSLQFDFILPYQPFEDKHRPWWKGTNKYSFSNYNVEVYLELVGDTDVKHMNTKLTNVLAAHSIAPGEDALFTFPFTSYYLNDDFSDGRVPTGKSKYIKLLSLVAFLILLIACINFINLYTAMMSNRVKEIGLRKVVGARKNQVVFQFLAESVLISVISTLLAITFVEVLSPAFELLSQKEVSLPYTSPIFLLLLFGGSIFIGVMAGLYPSLQFSSADLITEVKTGASATLRKYLVV
ncbi:FtsX-like permease family protein, partial [Fulvivirga sp. RKSG066]|uniref:ABC transporter permease n=1 Tax=Fulvivirga aurantia TaxID=2529383 RepID=UPI0012BD2DE2